MNQLDLKAIIEFAQEYDMMQNSVIEVIELYNQYVEYLVDCYIESYIEQCFFDIIVSLVRYGS